MRGNACHRLCRLLATWKADTVPGPERSSWDHRVTRQGWQSTKAGGDTVEPPDRP